MLAFAGGVPLAGGQRCHRRIGGATGIHFRHSGHVRKRRLSARAEVSGATEQQNSAFDIDKQFARLNHINKNLRKKAGAEIAANVTEETIPRLVTLLALEDTGHRRAAVQTLGMIGMRAVGPLCDALRNSENRTVRASCSKAIAAISMYYPEERECFPEEALAALEAALLEDPDPVTKIATVGCLGTLGSGIERESIKPNLRAIDFLLKLVQSTDDMGMAAAATGALGQIGASGQKERVIAGLRALIERPDDEDSGVNFIKEMANTHLQQLESGSLSPVLSS